MVRWQYNSTIKAGSKYHSSSNTILHFKQIMIPFIFALVCRFHQVNSYGNNLAVSQQWKHEILFNPKTYSHCTTKCDPTFTSDTVQFMGYPDLDVMPDQVRWELCLVGLPGARRHRNAILTQYLLAPSTQSLFLVNHISDYNTSFVYILPISMWRHFVFIFNNCTTSAFSG